jgi:hypothetical protein
MNIESIIAWEEGTLDEQGTLELFSSLIRTGRAWELQGSYVRAAEHLIDAGYLDEKGDIL